jgi:hypothetical protein
MNLRLPITVAKGLLKARLHRPLKGNERYLLAAICTPLDRVATGLVAMNVHPRLIDPDCDFVQLVASVEANLDLFVKLRTRFPKVDAIAPVGWLGLLRGGQTEMGTTMRITPNVEPTPEDYALDHYRLDELPMPKAVGYLKTQINLCVEIQRRFPEMPSPPVILGPYDTALMLRGEKLLDDFKLYKDFSEATDESLKSKMKDWGDPSFFSQLMAFATQASITVGKLHEASGMDLLGMVINNTFSYPPILSPDDFFRYVYPFTEEVWKTFKRYRPTVGYMSSSPALARDVMRRYPALSGVACYSNYMFPQSDIGLTPPEWDEEMLAFSKELRVPYQYQIHGKFLRDGTERELEDHVKRVCELAVRAQAPMFVSIPSIPLDTPLSRVDLVFDSAMQYGRYY